MGGLDFKAGHNNLLLKSMRPCKFNISKSCIGLMNSHSIYQVYPILHVFPAVYYGSLKMRMRLAEKAQAPSPILGLTTLR